MNQSRHSRPTRPQSHAKPQKIRGQVEAGGAGKHARVRIRQRASAKQCHSAWRRPTMLLRRCARCVNLRVAGSNPARGATSAARENSAPLCLTQASLPSRRGALPFPASIPRCCAASGRRVPILCPFAPRVGPRSQRGRWLRWARANRFRTLAGRERERVVNNSVGPDFPCEIEARCTSAFAGRNVNRVRGCDGQEEPGSTGCKRGSRVERLRPGNCCRDPRQARGAGGSGHDHGRLSGRPRSTGTVRQNSYRHAHARLCTRGPWSRLVLSGGRTSSRGCNRGRVRGTEAAGRAHASIQPARSAANRSVAAFASRCAMSRRYSNALKSPNCTAPVPARYRTRPQLVPFAAFKQGFRDVAQTSVWSDCSRLARARATFAPSGIATQMAENPGFRVAEAVTAGTRSYGHPALAVVSGRECPAAAKPNGGPTGRARWNRGSWSPA